MSLTDSGWNVDGISLTDLVPFLCEAGLLLALASFRVPRGWWMLTCSIACDGCDAQGARISHGAEDAGSAEPASIAAQRDARAESAKP